MSVKRVFFYKLIFISWVANLSAQSPDTLWTRTYGGINRDAGYSVQQTSEGGYIITGSTYYGSGDYDVYLIKTDANGDTLWTRTYGRSGANFDEWGMSVQQTFDGGYIITGSAGLHNIEYDIYLIKTDPDGDTLWTKTYGGTEWDRSWSVQQTSDSGYIIAGMTKSFGDDAWLIKTDANGDTLWTKTYGGGISWEIAYSVQQTSDGGYIITGGTHSFGPGTPDYSNVYLIKTDANGDTLWTKIYGGLHEDAGYSVQQTFDGGYIITGNTQSFGPGTPHANVWLLKTDSLGDTLWTKVYGGTEWDIGRSIQETSDSGYIIVGVTLSYGAGSADFYLIKTDALGDTLWTKTYGGMDDDEGCSIQQTTDSGYIIVGVTYSFGAGNLDVWLLKTEPEIGIEEETNNKMNDLRIPALVYGSILRLSGLNKHIEVKVFDVFGRKVLNQKISPKDSYVRLNNLPPGIYFLQIKTENQIKTEKIIVLK